MEVGKGPCAGPAPPSMCAPLPDAQGRPGIRRPRIGLASTLALLALGLGACRTPAAPVSTRDDLATMSMTPDPGLFGLGGGDVVTVTVRGHEDLSTPPGGMALDEAGNLQLPMVGSQNVLGETLAGATARIRAAYGEFMHEPDVTVALAERHSKRYFVLGQIKEPGPHPMVGPMTALEALGQGGFFLNAADRRNVFLLRPHGEDLEVHRFSAETPDPRGLVQVRPGDILFVRRCGTQRFQEEFLPLLQPWQIAVPAAAAAGVL